MDEIDYDNYTKRQVKETDKIIKACGIKIGDYIRTSGYYSFIAKIKRIEFDNEARLLWFIYDKKDFDTNITREWRINKPYIKKHSSNIIDLIEVGDYMNGYKVLDVMENMNTGEIHLEMPMDYTNKELGDCTIYNKDIISICTREQFKNAEYKLDN